MYVGMSDMAGAIGLALSHAGFGFRNAFAKNVLTCVSYQEFSL